MEMGEEKNTDFITGKEIMSWEAPEYFHHERTVDWYWWVGLAAVILLGFAVWQKSFLFGVLILLGWFTTILYAIRPPKIISFTLTDRGIIIEHASLEKTGKMYPWRELESFWIFYQPPMRQELSIKSKKTFMPYIKIQLAETLDPEKIKETVMKFIPEEEQQESLIDNLAHLAKF